MRTVYVSILCLTFAIGAFAQGGSGTLTGTIEDSTKALIPGVQVSAKNVATGVVTTNLSNESGAYTIVGLLPGTYELKAELSGFQSQTFNNIELGTNETKRFNFTLQVGRQETTVGVVVDATALLTVTGANVGEVLTGQKAADLPLVTGDVLDLVRILPGVRLNPLGGGFDTFAGMSANTVNTVRGGLS